MRHKIPFPVNTISIMKHQDILYYSDELNDEFSGIVRKTIIVDDAYRYRHGRLWRAVAWVLYRIIMTPVAYFYMKLCFCMKIVGRGKLRRHKGGGYFLYGNHTQIPGDGFMPTCITFPKRDIVMVNADNVSLYGTKNFMEMIGALPLPNRPSGMAHFIETLGRHLKKGRCIVIYPEAHIWPYYTKIRPFTEASFRYPAMYDKPVYCFTVTYKKGRRGRTNIVVYVDGPFYPPKDTNARQAAKRLREEVYNAMSARSRNSTYERIQYVKKGSGSMPR